MNEPDLRAKLVAEARSWLRTPYHHMGRIKGPRGGTDCAQLVYCVYRAVGLAPEIAADPYPPDWHLHRGTERYMAAVLEHAHEVERPRPGDVVLYRYGRAFAHGAIVLDYSRIVHALKEAGMVILDTADAGRLAGRERKFFSVFGESP